MGGDFKWTFDNSVDDTSYSLNRPLKDKLNAYKTSLVSVGGGSVSGTSHTHTYGEWVVVTPATETEEGLRAAHVQDVVIMKQQLFQLLEKIHLLHLTHRYQEMQRYITLQNQEQQVTSIVLQEA